uniref:C2H2-type domain-containing protein n=1 Tax=Plectus sambesii TaxID=2011161 RepID=A0A914XF75_9BILA
KDAASSNEDDEKKSFTEKIFCHVCQAGVHRLKKQHILEVHVKKPLYVCPHCEFFSVSSKQRVNRHARTKHPGEGPSLSAVDRETEYHQLIVEWERKCFPDDYKHEEPKSPSLAAKIGRRPPSTRSAVKIAFKWKPRRLRNSLAQQMPITNRHDTAPSTSHSKRPTSYCRLCSTQVPMPRIVHLYRDHLKRPLFKCPHCPFYSTYAKYRVNKHISNIHRNEPDKEVIDLLRDQSVLEEIAKLEAACWRLSNGYENEVKTAALDDRESDVRQVECLLCMEKVSSRMQQLHIYKDHLKVDDLFYCTKCGFKSSFNSNAVRRHVARLHADGEGYASRITDYVHKLVELEDSCFPVEHSPARRQQKLWAPCQQCGQSVMMCRRPMHVLIDHVNVADMFACRYCDIKSCYKRSYVTRHSRKQHNDVNIHSRMEEFQEVVEKQTKLCFPLAQKPSTRFIGLAKSGLSTSHCSVCNKEQTEGAAHHIRRAHLPPLFKSTACPFTTYSFVQVQDHVRNHHAHVFQF